ncbi:MAG: nucleotidyltransferase domain-containing protein [Pleurocapsa minor GSE-CHR-MK-17-07R]|jgi:predicted nucleotidyltransferase|nr:nucleotidyltransferase domain-containing protein [Pleurocapsa minor GSE-CHR-MK 17-07R]
MNLPLILPSGTQVVTLTDIYSHAGEILVPAGGVGVIVGVPVDPTHAYRVRFSDDSEHTLKRRDLTVRALQQEPIAVEHVNDEMFIWVIYRCVIGSQAYGLSHQNSDTDIRGIYLPPAEQHWSLVGVPEQLERGEETYWELEKFLLLALKANPNILECLYTPMVQHVTPLAQELLAMRHIFMSRLIYQTYSGYVASQFKKLQKDMENYGSIRWKHAMHLIRLLLAGITAMREKRIELHVGEQRERLLDIRRGLVTWEEINEWRRALHREFDLAFQTSELPERPDYELANAYLLRARRSMVRDL